jgi:penicillin amidase
MAEQAAENRRVHLDRLTGAALLIAGLAPHALRRRRGVTLERRLAMLPCKGVPVERPVTIRWNHHHIPFIEAKGDQDLAVGLGMVHAHLRLGQLEALRRLSQGRGAEMIGPLGIEADHLLRTLDFRRAVPAITAAMPAATRDWLAAFVRGINHYLANAASLPEEFAALAMRREVWSIADVLTLGRLLSADFNWVVWSRLLRLRDDPDWPRLWRRLLDQRTLSFFGEDEAADYAGLVARTGSNAFAVAPARSATGATLLASDPHLAFSMPGPWIVAGCCSPGFHAVGLMLPGMPFIALGRNRWIAWSGTNLHAASSDLVAVPAEAPMREREEEITVRWGWPKRILIRETDWGPVVSDVPFLGICREVLALRWIGHRASDEITAMLAVNRARDWDEFRSALNGFGVPGQNMVYADACGRIGQLMAAHLPCRTDGKPDDVVAGPGIDGAWDNAWSAADLPQCTDPESGYVASANERPADGAPVVGYHFSPPDRKQRLEHLIRSSERLSVAKIAQIQRDPHSATALMQRCHLVGWLQTAEVRDARKRRFIADLAAWNGDYSAQSRGALAFELLSHHLARVLIPNRRRAAYDAAWGTRQLIWEDVLAADPQVRQRALERALKRAAKDIGRRETWSARHRLRLGHPLALVPLSGRAYRFADRATGGSSETLMKTAHALTNRRHGSRYGSGARHISDLSDPDANFFVLLGGQDGWLGSNTLLDQLPLWESGEYVTVPLRPETARDTFPFLTELTP